MDLDKVSALYELTQLTGFPVLMTVLDELVKLQEQEVLRYDIHAKGVDELLYLKCEAQGARKLRSALDIYIKKLRVAALEA